MYQACTLNAIMKKFLSPILIIICCVMGVGCEKLSDLLKAEVIITVPMDFSIPVASTGDVINIDEWVTTVDLDNEITKVNNQLGAENVQSVNIQSVRLYIPTEERSENVNLTYLSHPIVYFQSDAVREWKNIASWTGALESANEQQLNINTAQDWTSYFNSTSRFFLKFQCQANDEIKEPIHVKGEVKFLVKVSA